MAKASFFLGVCERTVERHVSKFLVNGGVEPAASLHAGSSFRQLLCLIARPKHVGLGRPRERKSLQWSLYNLRWDSVKCGCGRRIADGGRDSSKKKIRNK